MRLKDVNSRILYYTIQILLSQFTIPAKLKCNGDPQEQLGLLVT